MGCFNKRRSRKNVKWATVQVILNGNHNNICVSMREGETKEEVKKRVEESLWGPPAIVLGIYSKPCFNPPSDQKYPAWGGRTHMLLD